MIQKKNKEIKQDKLILWFSEIRNTDVAVVGGKNASLGEMYSNLTKKGVNIPNGFAVTAQAYKLFLKESGIEKRMREILSDLDVGNLKNLQARGKKVRKTILAAEFPAELKKEIAASYKTLCKEYGPNTDVAVRSSATAEDLPDASFAGQQETYLNIHGVDALLIAAKKCFSSLFTDRAISYRHTKKFGQFAVYLSIGVQKMVRSDLACSGVMFTIDTESGFRDVALVTGSYGLGENIVQGRVDPDQFYVHKPTLRLGKKPIISRVIGSKDVRMIYSNNKSKPTVNVKTSLQDAGKFCITNSEVLNLAKWGCIIEDHYKKPMDIEWAKDGRTGKIFIVQARPETVQSRRDVNVLEKYSLLQKGKILITGLSVGEKIGAGKAGVIKDVKNINQFKKGDVLVTEMTDPDWEPIMRMSSAIVTEKGGRTCHAAIISRELGIPCVVGTGNCTKVLKSGKMITVSCAEGEAGYVYEGALKFNVKKTNLKNLPELKTKIMLNVGNPEQAFDDSFIPNDGVGLAREEFIIMSYIKVHPLALLNYRSSRSTRSFLTKGQKSLDAKLKKEIDDLTKGYTDKAKFFVDKLAEGIGTIGAAFYPKDVIVRLSDFKTNEYANLVGGSAYEPKEENPMIGWRGASRYYDDKYKAAFALECKALKKVRDEFGLNNVKIMIPFCRTPEEGKKVIAEMGKNGLKQHENGLEIYVMCEIPSNVILADKFSEIFDGFSIGSNDLTQLTLGIDRDSGIVTHIANEKNEAVKRMICAVIKVAKQYKRKIGICGQAPSDFPDFAEFLIEQGIDSISLNPDSVIKTRMMLGEMQKTRNGALVKKVCS
ncbi:MAG: phosphoenolpyruvate synthase [Nanoarchaeota archaeon]|nr:phosphoenolpyruvate synthase [Nanoarchaeota archaeon]MBU4299792.1 phosphoenolpyruvate synthase [Nanoarchaeota archaeon]MBU4451270.1 phosphoenolpyruvate synthase [Nanoarchaeota archaeon]MCG2724021.1 phosphoenolpyruvate synthase [archaeon]